MRVELLGGGGGDDVADVGRGGACARRNSSVSCMLALTRYCYTSKLYCESLSSLHCPAHLQSLPHCKSIGRSLHDIRPPRPLTDPPRYAIRHSLLVIAILCKGRDICCVNPTRIYVAPPMSENTTEMLGTTNAIYIYIYTHTEIYIYIYT